MLILILILYDPTTLIYPPFAHTLGYHKATLSHLRLATGKPVDALGITGISAAKIKFLDDPSTHKDDDELSMFLCDFVSNSILYNIGLTDFGMYKSPVIGGDALWFPSDCEITPSGELFVVNRITKYKVYVTDYGNNRIEIFDHQGNFLSLIGAFDHPTGIVAVSSDDPWLRYSESYIVVIDSCKSRLTKLTPDGKILSIVHKDELIYPRVQFEYIAVDYYGLIWVTDSYNNCLHLFDRNLKYIVKFGRKGTGDKEFLYPKGITIWRRYGQVFVADSRSIQYFWVGVDAWIKGVRPGVFKPKEGVTVSYYLTQPALITAYIYDSSGRKIRTLKLGRIKELGQKYLLWDTISEEGQPVGEGKYRIELVLKPTYSSRGKFEKKISVDVQCRP
jgi:hypothetical protein